MGLKAAVGLLYYWTCNSFSFEVRLAILTYMSIGYNVSFPLVYWANQTIYY